ncbi:VOC family protein [Bacteroidia bacterium]|nr:VOC family protein [Bacteroidia bacterium]GHT63238.1 VOC family protein [Bacteroidia bacterium]
MATVNIYLTFNGTCEAAFNFYKSVFGGEFFNLSKYRDMPSPDRPLSESEKEKVMHVNFPISKETKLMGCDTLDEFVPGNNFSIAVNPENEAEGRNIFAGLSEGGNVVMPIEKTFWNSLFGMVVDKFGVCWMVDYQLSE